MRTVHQACDTTQHVSRLERQQLQLHLAVPHCQQALPTASEKSVVSLHWAAVAVATDMWAVIHPSPVHTYQHIVSWAITWAKPGNTNITLAWLAKVAGAKAPRCEASMHFSRCHVGIYRLLTTSCVAPCAAVRSLHSSKNRTELEFSRGREMGDASHNCDAPPQITVQQAGCSIHSGVEAGES